ncbi:hypothetical protein [Amycolatopsis sp. cmx-4-68]|uniref:hypothetical protein n=1 Tax=Amycolatopsis sp. cmx-4-68 TaxID=2790938 RepID=UPI00397CFD8D
MPYPVAKAEQAQDRDPRSQPAFPLQGRIFRQDLRREAAGLAGAEAGLGVAGDAQGRADVARPQDRRPALPGGRHRRFLVRRPEQRVRPACAEPRRVQVRVVDAGQHRAPGQVEHFGVRSDVAGEVAADGGDPPVAHGEPTGHRARRAEGVHDPAVGDQVGRDPLCRHGSSRPGHFLPQL